MKNISILTILLSVPLLGFSQVQFSGERPEVPTIVKQLQSKVDTVYLLTQSGIEKGIRVTPVYQVIYDQDRSQEEELFYGNSDFFIQEKSGYWDKPVKPMAYRLEVDFTGVTSGGNHIQFYTNPWPWNN